jgi:putative aldouronate transport system substrate-binding protein
MKKNKLALGSLLMAIILLITACSGSGGGGGSQSGSGGGGSSSDGGKPVEIVMAYLAFTDVSDIQTVEDEINKIAREKINVVVDLMPIDGAAWTQQTNLLLAGNEKIDIILTSSFFNYNSQVSRGQLLELDELLEQYGPEIKNTMPEAIYNGTRINGKIYGIPSVRDFAADYGMVMRKDLVDKYNIDLSKVKTWADLTGVFKVIKENEPGIVPLVPTTQTYQPTRAMYSPEIDPLGDSLGVILIDDQDKKVVNLYELDLYREKLELVKQWYDAGYLSADAATTQEASANVVKAGKAFGYFNNLKPGYAIQESQLTGYEMVSVSLSPAVIQSNSASSFMISIARNSTDPVAAMKFLNLLYTDPDVMNLLANGVEGKHYVKKDNGFIGKPEGVTETGYQFNQWEIGNNFLTLVWEGWDADIWEQTKKFNESGKVSPALGFSFDQTPVKSEVAAVTNVQNQYLVGLESGTLEIEMLDNFINELKAAGIDRIIEEKQRQLDEWAKANGKK